MSDRFSRDFQQAHLWLESGFHRNVDSYLLELITAYKRHLVPTWECKYSKKKKGIWIYFLFLTPEVSHFPWERSHSLCQIFLSIFLTKWSDTSKALQATSHQRTHLFMFYMCFTTLHLRLCIPVDEVWLGCSRSAMETPFIKLSTHCCRPHQKATESLNIYTDWLCRNLVTSVAFCTAAFNLICCCPHSLG